MIINAISRRSLLKTGTYTLVGTPGLLWAASALAREDSDSEQTTSAFQVSQSGNAGDRVEEGSNMAKENAIRQYYSGWEKKEWNAIDNVLADSFSFTSPNDDDHIGKGAFKARCWGQADYIERFDLETVVVRDNEAFVKYLCRTTKGTSFRNTEYFRFAGGKISAVEVYFGGRLGYPTAAISGKP